ncbi:ABC transporter ATP-binding protein [Methylovirgula sp. 4M-Z18]|uniref:ABC transporter ATP-binding protein n=1 Tax=Methylovirgula sp. 4M-Z18 TaxID=2293567 RepID=UPI000E2F3422|nr:ATP-binding cassette domain-containing protein [Methylovirgula sp. 4M-Z18]RFB78451.1 ATP-binding cassette domain-containing protein [Methylovirgula sp. 4M-Z18]
MAVLEAFDLYKFFHTPESETLALRGVSLKLDAGELVTVVGPSGSGKSTLLACLSGLDEPDGGYVELLGERLTRRSEADRACRRGAHVGIFMQSRNLFPSLSVADNIRLVMSVARKIDNDRAKQLLVDVGLADRETARPGQLSGGELARAGLAVALAAAPRILLADEPTGEVDVVTESAILDLLGEQCRAGVAVLVVTHSEALTVRADRIIHLRDGRMSNA